MILDAQEGNRLERKRQALRSEVIRMLENTNPLTGIYSIYGDYPIENWRDGRPTKSPEKKLETMCAAR